MEVGNSDIKKFMAGYNKEHGIEPQTIYKSTDDILIITEMASKKKEDIKIFVKTEQMSNIEKLEIIDKMTEKMHSYAVELDFEQAAKYRDMIREVKRSIRL